MKNLNNKVNISSAALGNFVYHGLYETYIGEQVGYAAPKHRNEIDDKIGELYMDILTEVLFDEFPSDIDDEFELAYQGTYHPKYYNFETDSINFEFSYSENIKEYLLEQAKDNENFVKFLKDNYTSCDGFISFTPNDYDEWFEGFNNNDWRCVAALLRFVFSYLTFRQLENYEMSFNEEVHVLIAENYLDWCYAEKFDNGLIGVVYQGYNCEEDYGYFDAYLIDEYNNVINHITLKDEYDELGCSPYAAWFEIEYDLTKNYSLCDYTGFPCEVPEGIYDLIKDNE